MFRDILSQLLMWAESSFERALFAGKMHYRLNLATGEAEHIKFFSELYTLRLLALCVVHPPE